MQSQHAAMLGEVAAPAPFAAGAPSPEVAAPEQPRPSRIDLGPLAGGEAEVAAPAPFAAGAPSEAVEAAGGIGGACSGGGASSGGGEVAEAAGGAGSGEVELEARVKRRRSEAYMDGSWEDRPRYGKPRGCPLRVARAYAVSMGFSQIVRTIHVYGASSTGMVYHLPDVPFTNPAYPNVEVALRTDSWTHWAEVGEFEMDLKVFAHAKNLVEDRARFDLNYFDLRNMMRCA